MKLDQDRAYYSRAYAWYDPEGDESLKSTYRFIHHFVDGNGNPGAASTRACIAGIAVLNGARGGTTIPDRDRLGVWRHLARHLEDAGIEPPELIERRALQPAEVRVREEPSGGSKIVGYAAVFDELSLPLGPRGDFRERIRKGAFAQTIAEDDIRALWNHNADWVLGRNRAGTLVLAEDNRGLAVEITPPDTQWARDLLVSIRRGDVNQMSFGFEVLDQSWGTENGESVRTLHRVRLYDVSVVAFPAYTQTDAWVRSSIDRLAQRIESLERRLRAHELPRSAPVRLVKARRRLRLLENNAEGD